VTGWSDEVAERITERFEAARDPAAKREAMKAIERGRQPSGPSPR
jgi:hypothetical protein